MDPEIVFGIKCHLLFGIYPQKQWFATAESLTEY